MTLAVSMLAAAPSASAADEAPVARGGVERTEKPSTIPGHYIVVMDPASGHADQATAARQALARGGQVSAVYRSALNGFAARLPEQAVEALRRNPNVQYVEPDAVVEVADTQKNATWGLDRIDQTSRRLNREYRYDKTGAGVTAYILDTGIRRGHKQFGNRVAGGFSAVDDGRGTKDCDGHGTHVAGTVGSSRYGVAKKVTLRPVRVLNCRGRGRTSWLISGVEWVTSHHKAGPAVANMSLSGGASRALDDAVRSSIIDGVTYTLAAGNEDDDACRYSPARVGSALTVGATTRSDERSPFSNTGVCVDLFAPGSEIASTWHTSNTAATLLSGTSMAAPHVAGAAALILQRHPKATPDQVAEALLDSATRGVVTNRGASSPNRLLFSRASGKMPAPSDNVLVNGGFEKGKSGWTATARVVTDDAHAPARQGSWKAWLNGYGEPHVDTLRQTVMIPPGTSARLSFSLLIATREPRDARDTLKVAAVAGGMNFPLATYSNLDAQGTYEKLSLDVTGLVGQMVTFTFTGKENGSRATDFVIDNVVLTSTT